MDRNPSQTDDARKVAWDRHNLDQLLYFRALSLRQKLLAVEGMCDVARRFEQMRARGEFREADAVLDPAAGYGGETGKTRKS